MKKEDILHLLGVNIKFKSFSKTVLNLNEMIVKITIFSILTYTAFEIFALLFFFKEFSIRNNYCYWLILISGIFTIHAFLVKQHRKTFFSGIYTFICRARLRGILKKKGLWEDTKGILKGIKITRANIGMDYFILFKMELIKNFQDECDFIVMDIKGVEPLTAYRIVDSWNKEVESIKGNCKFILIHYGTGALLINKHPNYKEYQEEVWNELIKEFSIKKGNNGYNFYKNSVWRGFPRQITIDDNIKEVALNKTDIKRKSARAKI